MIKTSAIINNKKGIHVRPSGLIFKAIMGYKGTIMIIKDNVETQINDIISILILGLGKDDKIIITVDGPDEEIMVESLKVLFERSYEFEEM